VSRRYGQHYPGCNGHTTLSYSRYGRRLRDVEAATPHLDPTSAVSIGTFEDSTVKCGRTQPIKFQQACERLRKAAPTNRGQETENYTMTRDRACGYGGAHAARGNRERSGRRLPVFQREERQYTAFASDCRLLRCRTAFWRYTPSAGPAMLPRPTADACLRPRL